LSTVPQQHVKAARLFFNQYEYQLLFFSTNGSGVNNADSGRDFDR
jgi:hypothetical protein